MVRHLVMSPAFNCHARSFLAEIHRQSDVTCLYYLLPSQGAVSIVAYMIPVLPRKRTEYDLTKLSGIEPSSCVLRSRAPCALYHMNKRFSSLRKMTIAIHIVVVSTSATALAFLERLLFGPWCVYLTFFNVSVVTPHGLPDTAGRQFLPQRSHFSPAYLSLLSLPTWVNVVYGDVTAIDRQEKHVCVNGAATLPYDYLFFFNEEVFLKPDCQLPKGREGHASREDGEDMASELQNVFYVNCETDAANMLVAVTSITSQLHEYNILVYGHNIEAFCCVKALVESGIPGRCVSFVEPLESPSVNCFNDRAVYEAMLEELLREGVQVFSGCYFHHWVIHSHEPLVTHVAFEAHTHCLYLTCAAVLYYGNKDVSDELFSVLNDASLVYDGRLVINTQFQTNDPHILAAGPLTKYARRLFADKFNHCLYNQVEVGTKVADSMMQQWDPMRTEEQVEDSVQLPPVFTKPVVVHCTLPGGVNYLHVRRPGVSVPAAVSTGKDSNDRVIQTGNCHENNYFRLQLDAFNKVETITCYSKQALPVGNLINLYGKHEKLLNNLMVRYNTGRIADLYEYFSQPWAYAIFHDKFEIFQEEARNMVLPEVEEAGAKTLENTCLGGQLASSVVGYIADNMPHLPMYANPQLLRLLRHERETSPLHKEQGRTTSCHLDPTIT